MEEGEKGKHTPFTKEVLESLGDFEQDVLDLMGDSRKPVETADILADLVRIKKDNKSYTNAINELVARGLLKRDEVEGEKETVVSRDDVQQYFDKYKTEE